MKHLVKHLLQNNLNEILSKSLLNCHAIGLHSIMLLDSPGKTIRLFIAVEGNELYRNGKENTYTDRPMSVGFHSHHCNLTLYCIKGQFINWVVEKHDGTDPVNWSDLVQTEAYEYKSLIKQGELQFIHKHKQTLKTVYMQQIEAGNSVHLKANELHTVICKKDQISAWFVFEGKEDPNYDSTLYTNTNPNEQDNTQLYHTMGKNDLFHLLKLVDLA